MLDFAEVSPKFKDRRTIIRFLSKSKGERFLSNTSGRRTRTVAWLSCFSRERMVLQNRRERMKWFSRPGLLTLTLLGGVVGAELWQRRRLKQIVRQIAHYGYLTQAAIRITNEIRGLIDVSQILRRTALEVAQTLNTEHCCVLLFGKSNKEEESACSCESRNHEREIEIAFASAIKYLLHESSDRFITHNDPNSADAKAGRTRYPVCGLPITRDVDGSGGFLLVLSNDPTRLWSESEIQMLLAVAHQLCLSIANARRFAEKVQQSLTDSLTNCLNRRGFDEQFENFFQAASEHNRSISLIMIDLDFFKAINDTFGHAIGDDVLRKLAGILLEETENGGIGARVGGEEFAFLLSDHSAEEAAAIAERLRQRVSVMAVPRLDRHVTISCGVASAPVHANSTASLYALADDMLYRAKASGRNRVCVCEVGATPQTLKQNLPGGEVQAYHLVCERRFHH